MPPCAGRLSKEISPIFSSQQQMISLSSGFLIFLSNVFWVFFCLFFNIHTFKAQFLGGFSAQKEVQKPQMSAGAHGRKRWSRWVFRSRQKTVGRTSKCVPKQVMKRRSRGGAASAERKKGNHRSIPPHRQRRVSVLPPRASQPE